MEALDVWFGGWASSFDFVHLFLGLIGKVETKDKVGLIGGKVMAFWFCCGKVSTRYDNNS